MQNLIVCKTKIFNIPYKFINSDITVYTYEEAVYVFYENFTVHLEDIKSDSFSNWLDKIGVDNTFKPKKFCYASIDDSIFYFVKNSNLFDEAQLDEFKIAVIDFYEKSEFEKYKIIGYNCLKINKVFKAIEYYKKSLSLNENVDMLYNLGYLHKIIRDYSSAKKYLLKAYEQVKDIMVIEELLDCFIKTNNVEKANELLKICGEHFSNDVFSYYIGEVCGLEKRFTEQIYFYIEAYNFNNDKRYGLKIIDYYISHRNFKEAENFINEIEFDDIDIIIKVAEFIRDSEGAKKAVLFLEKYSNSYRNNKKYLISLSKCKRLSYDLVGSESTIIHAENLFPEDKEVLFEHSIIKKSKGFQKDYTNDIKLIMNELVTQYRG